MTDFSLHIFAAYFYWRGARGRWLVGFGGGGEGYGEVEMVEATPAVERDGEDPAEGEDADDEVAEDAEVVVEF